MSLPGDNHCHTQWSYDALLGDMLGSCQRALQLGLPAIAFTEHAEFEGCRCHDALPPHLLALRDATSGVLTPLPLDPAGYRECLDLARTAFPQLRILSGVEFDQPHRHPVEVAAVMSRLDPHVCLGSVHSVRVDGVTTDPVLASEILTPAGMLEVYLNEVRALVRSDAPFTVLAHLDYPQRYVAGLPELSKFEEHYRLVLQELAASGRALEFNTKGALTVQLLRWWREEGGTHISFGSAPHEPERVAWQFADAAALAGAAGFRPGDDPWQLWRRA